MQLHEQYRPKRWDDVIGQEKAIGKIRLLAKRGLSGRAYWISGQSGTGKTTIARLIAAEVADEFCTEEIDATDLTPAALRDLERSMRCRGFGDSGKTGRAYIVNEAHGLRKDTIRQQRQFWMLFRIRRDYQKHLHRFSSDARTTCHVGHGLGRIN